MHGDMHGDDGHPWIIAVDGPAGGGKTTVSDAIARILGIAHINSGRLYRALTMRLVEEGLVVPGVKMLGPRAIARIKHDELRDDLCRVASGVPRSGLYTTMVDSVGPVVAAAPSVRALIATILHRQARLGACVVEGRDIGTRVFPGADVKLYLDCDESVRAERVAQRMKLIQVNRDGLQTRDRADAVRSSPAADAFVIDTSTRTVAEVTERALEYIARHTSP